LQPNTTYRLKIVFLTTTSFYIDNHLVFEAPELPHGWIAPPFLGKGTDNNYAEHNEQAGANKVLTLNIRML